MAIFNHSYSGASSSAVSGTESPPDLETETNDLDQLNRWAALAGGSALTLYGLRRGSLLGLLLVIVGGRLAWRAAMMRPRGLLATLPAAERPRASSEQPRTSGHASRSAKTEARMGFRRPPGLFSDQVSEASDESFPASDAPAWTHMTTSSRHVT